MMRSHVTLIVKDQDAALEFYTNMLGFEKRAGHEQPGEARWLTVAPKGQDIQLVLWKAGPAPHLDLPASHRAPGIGTRCVLEVEDCRKTFAQLKALGVNFKDPQDGRPLSEPREERWGFGANFTDPDGNPFTLHETREPSATADRAKTSQKA